MEFSTKIIVLVVGILSLTSEKISANHVHLPGQIQNAEVTHSICRINKYIDVLNEYQNICSQLQQDKNKERRVAIEQNWESKLTQIQTMLAKDVKRLNQLRYITTYEPHATKVQKTISLAAALMAICLTGIKRRTSVVDNNSTLYDFDNGYAYISVFFKNDVLMQEIKHFQDLYYILQNSQSHLLDMLQQTKLCLESINQLISTYTLEPQEVDQKQQQVSEFVGAGYKLGKVHFWGAQPFKDYKNLQNIMIPFLRSTCTKKVFDAVYGLGTQDHESFKRETIAVELQAIQQKLIDLENGSNKMIQKFAMANNLLCNVYMFWLHVLAENDIQSAIVACEIYQLLKHLSPEDQVVMAQMQPSEEAGAMEIMLKMLDIVAQCIDKLSSSESSAVPDTYQEPQENNNSDNVTKINKPLFTPGKILGVSALVFLGCIAYRKLTGKSVIPEGLVGSCSVIPDKLLKKIGIGA